MQVLTSRNIHEHILATPLFGNDAMFGELLAHTLGRSTGLSILLTATTMGTFAAFA